MIFRMRYRELGGHTHVRVFAGMSTGSLGLCGVITFRNEEWRLLKILLNDSGIFEILQEEE